ncbi:hypothetical protein COLO4_05875 [Corchorus olitorius]|uniref:Aminotransferase-like plant mobile domain-containing protein n=1 Tax=Corchorus olitorius TaxID=93759 RepID=A0A1R3KPM4_9ROSI|nr:hypothetical protein COLO4_05875 [Corchorus olitorius]
MATTHSGAPPRMCGSKKRHVRPKVDDGPARKKTKSHHSSKSFDRSWGSLRRAYLNHDKLCFEKGVVPPSKVKFMGTRGIRNWNDWVTEILSNDKYQKILKSAGVFDAVRVTTNLLHIQDLKTDKVDVWCVILSRWSTYSHTMVTSWGEFTFTLEDVSALLHLPMVYDSEENLDNVENPFDEDALKKGERKALSALSKAVRHGGKPRTITSYVKKCRDEDDAELQPFQLECFLLLWLARFVFPGNPVKGISVVLIPLAIHISKGFKLPLGPLYLGSLYARLDLLHEKIKASMGAFEVVAFLDLPFIQMCLWERFPLAAPNCNKSYTCLLEGYGDPSKYPTDSSIPSEHMRSWVFTRELPAIIEVSDKAKEFSWLTKFYLPFRVALHFGYDQVAPHRHVANPNHTFMHCLTSFSAQRLPKSNYLIPSSKRVGKKVHAKKNVPSTVTHTGAAIGVASPSHSDVDIIGDPPTKTTPLPSNDVNAVSPPTTNITSLPSNDASGAASPRHDDDGGDVEIVSESSSDDDHSQDDDEPEVDVVALKRGRVRHTSSSPGDSRVRLTSSSPRDNRVRLTSSSPGDNRVRLTSSSLGVGRNTSGATPATPRTSPHPASSSVDEMGFDQPVSGFHNFPVKAMYVAPLKEAELRGGKFWESTILESETTIAHFLNQIVGMKDDPEVELAQITEELEALDAEKKRLSEAWKRVQGQVARLEAKLNNIAPIRDSLEAFHQGRSFFPPP